jgi:hypothetical protein
VRAKARMLPETGKTSARTRGSGGERAAAGRFASRDRGGEFESRLCEWHSEAIQKVARRQKGKEQEYMSVMRTRIDATGDWGIGHWQWSMQC